MQDVFYILATIAFFVLMAAFVVGCERIIGVDDGESTPGGLTDDVTETVLVEEVAR